MNIPLNQTEKDLLRKIVPHAQLLMMLDSNELQTLIPQIIEQIRATPKLYEQEQKGMKALVYLHYFFNQSDWYVSELNLEEDLAFGYVCLNGDHEMAEIGYFSISELVSIAVINIDLHWTYQTLEQAIQQSNHP